MIHNVKEQRLDIGHVAWEVETQELPIAATQSVISGKHSTQYKDGDIRPLALADNIVTGADKSGAGLHPSKRPLIGSNQCAVLGGLGHEQV
jgi:hypothetical protein